MDIYDATLLAFAIAFVFSLTVRLVTVKRIPTSCVDGIPQVTHTWPFIGPALEFVWNPMQFFKACTYVNCSHTI